MLNLTSIVETLAQRADPVPSSNPTALHLAQRDHHRRLSVAKRLFDLFVAAAALVILAPMLAALALAVRLAIGTPILFKQIRPGLHRRPFTIYKFRTMSNARNTAGDLLPDAERLGWFGEFLRSTSLDELPELINVLRGEMSIVGPRPLLMEYLPRYSAEQMRRHDLLPGITGFAQINGRNAASWPRKFELDVWYVDHRSMWLDLKIIAVTVWKVLTREGINQSASVTSEPFMGNVDLAHSEKPSLGAENNGARAMNVLLTCAGRRCFAIRAFKQALNNCGRVLACDATAQAPALQIADKAFVVPSVDADNYVDVILRICRDQRVRLLIPALEPELPLFATHRARFLETGTLPLVSSAEIVATCYDKLETAKFLERCGLIVPRTYVELEAVRQALARGEITFPLVVKPRWGVSSIGLAIAEDDEELHLAFNTTEKQIGHSSLAQVSAGAPGKCILIQERLSGDEYGLDILNDLNGRYVCTFVKRKLKMRAGQTDRAVTVKDKEIEKLGQLIGEQLGHFGILDCDLFASDQGYRVIDLNPRIGGGYPFSHLAGANVPSALIAWMNGEEADPSCFQIQPNLAIARCDEYVAIDPRIAFPTAQRRAQTHESTQKQLR
jgi:carbamoyl-phosphate synthase large subunit